MLGVFSWLKLLFPFYLFMKKSFSRRGRGIYISGWLKARSAGRVLSLVPLRSNSTLAVRSQSNAESSVCALSPPYFPSEKEGMEKEEPLYSEILSFVEEARRADTFSPRI